MTGPRHISEILPSVLSQIEDAYGRATGDQATAVGSADHGSAQPGSTPRSTGASPATPAVDDRDAHQDRVGAQAQGLTIELPFPPSVNTYWGTRVVGKGKRQIVMRYINEAGKKFKQDVLEHFLVENITHKFSGPIACTVDLHPPCNRRRDCDNYCKGLLDALGAAGLYDDDSQIIDLHIRMHPKLAPGRVVVTLTPISAPHSAHNQAALL